MAKEKYQNALLQSMSIIADQSVKKAGYDTTIQATIIKCVDPTIEQYQIKYQGAYWYAYGNGAGVNYPNGCNVYILIPKGDMSQLKTILGTVQKLGINYVNPIAEEDKYEETGGNVISSGSSSEFGLCSYKTKDSIVLYGGASNKISINNTNLVYYLKTASHLCCSFTVRTNLNPQQKYKGKYGIKFEIQERNVKDSIKNPTITKQYVIDTDALEGNPYNFTNPINQKIFLEIDTTNFIKITKVQLFSEGFPNVKNNPTADIFISNLSFQGMKMLTQEEMDTVALSFVARQGYIFESGGVSSLPIEAIVRAAGKTVNNSSQYLKYYWFIRNVTITANNVFYCKEGGQGWKCLNNYKVISETQGAPTKIEYNSAGPIYNVTKTQAVAKKNKYKCVVIYGDKSYSKEFTIKNDTATCNVTITSDKGTEFESGLGTPTLTCDVTGISSGISYHWTITDQTGVSIQYGGNTKSITYDVQKIVGFNRFSCSVVSTTSNSVIGTGQITLVNKKTSDGGFVLNIINGQQVFNYNEQGLSPCKNKLINYVIPQLSFKLYDKKGIEIDQNLIDLNNITWSKISSSGIITALNAGTNGHSRTASYTINDYFKSNVRNDNIQLVVNYAGYRLTTRTNFVFTQEGYSGTNGTGMVAIIKVNYNGSVKKDNHVPIVSNTYTNFNSLQAQLYRNGTKVASDVTYGWRVLKNNNDNTYITITVDKNDSSIARITKKGNIPNYTNPFSNIVQAELVFDTKSYFATLPIITAENTSSYYIQLKENSGYDEILYSQDGLYPKFTKKPFQFVVRKANGDDVSDDASFAYVNNDAVTSTTASKKGAKTYTRTPGTRYDGSNISKYVRCKATINGNTLHINVPIYQHLNLYGHSALNGWNGNSIQFNSTDNGVSTILTPQIGAGSKDDKTNTFTGMLMGKVKGNDGTKTGLFGYSAGARSIFLDADTGNATFGIKGNGQIIIKPSSGTITGGAYSTTDKTGMQIDLKTPSIKFGSGNFSVTKEGYLTSRGGGSIAGWNISNTALTKSKVGLSSDFYSRDAKGNIKKDKKGNNITDYTKKAIWAGSTDSEKAPFSADFNGSVKMSSASIGGEVEVKDKKGNVTGIDRTKEILINKGKIYTTGKTAIGNNNEGFYLAADGLKIGSNFKADSNGEIIAKKGFIGNGKNGFVITDSAIYNEKDKLTADSRGIYLGTDGISLGKKGLFSVTDEGVLKATSGKIAGWIFAADGFYNNTALKEANKVNAEVGYEIPKAKKSKTNVVGSEGIYFGSGGIRLGKNFHVNSNGNLYANEGVFAGKITSSEGQIGAWTLSASGLTSTNGKMKLDSAGNIKAGNIEIKQEGSISGGTKKTPWSIDKNGKATFADLHVTGGDWSGGTISGGNRTGGGITGGSISTGKVHCGKNADGSNRSMNQWCKDVSFDYITVTKKATIKEIAAEAITADRVKTAISNVDILTVKSISAESIKVGKNRGILVATQTWVSNAINDKIKNLKIPTKVVINGTSYTLQ